MDNYGMVKKAYNFEDKKLYTVREMFHNSATFSPFTRSITLVPILLCLLFVNGKIRKCT